MTKHSRYGGSKAAQWLNCPGSVPLSDKAPERLSSSYAEEGSFAHLLAEQCLLAGQMDARPRIGSKLTLSHIASTKAVDDDMADAVNVYLDEVWTKVEAGMNELSVEEKFVLPIPGADEGEVFGSNDATVYNPVLKRLTVYDYKHGKGFRVFAQENKQLMFYAAGAVACHPEWDVRSIELVIVQPRGFFDDPISRWEMPLWMLVDYPAQIDAAVKDSKSEEPTFKAGYWCRWCPASDICTVREKSFLEAAKLDFATVTDITPETELPDPAFLDIERMAAILESFEPFEAWVSSIRDRIEALALSGQVIPGFKVVDKVARRKWAENDEEIVTYLTMFQGLAYENVMPRKLVTITEVEKQLKAKLSKTEFAPVKADMTMRFMMKESSGYAVVNESDRRPSVVPVAQEFGTVNLESLFDGE